MKVTEFKKSFPIIISKEHDIKKKNFYMRRLEVIPSKWGYVEVLVFCSVPTIFFIQIEGVVIDEKEEWTLKHQYRCYLNIKTAYGVATDMNNGHCLHLFHSSQIVTMSVRVGRISNEIIIMNGTIRTLL